MWTPLAVIAVTVVAVGVRAQLIRRSWRLLQTATETGAVDVAKRQLARLKRLYARHEPTLNLLHLTHAWLLVEEERYSDARWLLEHTDPDKLQAVRLPFYEAELALCLAHTGDVERGVELAHMAAWRAGNVNPPLLPYCQGAVGVTLHLAGRSTEAIVALQDGLRTGDAFPHGQAWRAFHLGEAMRAIGRADEAQQAYDRARRAAPGSRWSGRAEERLVALAERSPYR
jgi:hypothetical protein